MEKVKVELPTNMTESEKSCEKERKNKEAIEGYLEKFNNSLPSKYQFLEDRYGDLKLAEGLVKKNVFLHGETGSGKTVLGILILYEIIKIRKQVKFISCSDFIYGLQGDYQASEDKVRSVMDFRGCLMLDDLGAEKLTDFVRQTYYLIINHREQNELQTIITSNYNLNEIDTMIDRRLSSRICGRCEIIERKGDRRLEGKRKG